jgi:hypothetical protein
MLTWLLTSCCCSPWQRAAGVVCPRLVLDDHLMMWGLDPAKDAVRLMPTTSWKGRWPQPAADSDDDSNDDEQDAALKALAAQEASEALLALPAAGVAADRAAESREQQQQQVITCISSPTLSPTVQPMHPQGLTVLLPEVLKLVFQVGSSKACSAAMKPGGRVMHKNRDSCKRAGSKVQGMCCTILVHP